VFGDLERALGKRYRAFEYHGAADAQFVVVTIGGIGDVFRHAADEINRTGKVRRISYTRSCVFL
jgi:pyruvate/2-oxoacid:ferredoxin oxidoreductase alpha subunit